MTLVQDEALKQLRYAFLDKYILCEETCKTVLMDYFLKENKKTVKADDIKLNLSQIVPAFKLAKIPVDKEVLEKIFGAETIRGSKSAKKLRNGIVHAMNKNDILEVQSREQELFEYMDEYIRCIGTQESAKKEAVTT